MNRSRFLSLLFILSLFLSQGFLDFQELRAAAQPPPPKTSTAGDPFAAFHNLAPEIQAKVDPRLLQELSGEIIPAHLGGTAEQTAVAVKDRQALTQTRFLVYLAAQANLEKTRTQHYPTLAAQRTAVVNALLATAQSTQAPIRRLLERRKSVGEVTDYQSFYIFNGMAVEGDLNTIIELAQRQDVNRIVANYPLISAAPGAADKNLTPDNWNIDLIDADRVWNELGIRGTGAVVADLNLGVIWTHSAITSQYRGNQNNTVNHNYNWFEPDRLLHTEGNLGASTSNAPRSCNSYGFQPLGTVLGDGGTANTHIGVAPAAQWIAVPALCRDNPATLMADDIIINKSFEWLLCPTDLSGKLSTRDCSKAPDVINNSWSSSNPYNETFRPALQALRAAGIAPVFASGDYAVRHSGNIGSPGSLPEAIVVGATDDLDRVAPFSNRGPGIDPQDQKPELTAPGVDIYSAAYHMEYYNSSGTAVAASSVSGLLALMISADLQDGHRDYNVDELERIMELTAVDLGSAGPDNDSGYGRIDAYRAVRWILSAGNFHGSVQDAGSGNPLPRAVVTAASASHNDTLTTTVDAAGNYSLDLPADTYHITVQAFGYTTSLTDITILSNTVTTRNFQLVVLPAYTLTGQIQSTGQPISNTVVSLTDHPYISTTTGSNGHYTLTLPTGLHHLTVKAPYYRWLRQTVTIAAGENQQNFELTTAPKILFVEADTHQGSFYGRPVHLFFKTPLETLGYPYDYWPIQSVNFTDTTLWPNGEIGHGIPSTQTLAAYDIVIWAHTLGDPATIKATDELQAYLDGGGRLLLSGKNIFSSSRRYPYTNGNDEFFHNYLHSEFGNDKAADIGAGVQGQDFLAGLNFTLEDSTGDDAQNYYYGFSPDSIQPYDNNAYPVMRYANGRSESERIGTSVPLLAVAPCNQPYRALYFAVGFETLAPRPGQDAGAHTQLLERSIQWLLQSPASNDLQLMLDRTTQSALPGEKLNYRLTLFNQGRTADRYDMALSNTAWPTQLFLDGQTITRTPEIAPCGRQQLEIEVAIPITATRLMTQPFTLTATSAASDVVHTAIQAESRVMPTWAYHQSMSNPRYNFGTVAVPGTPYIFAVGGEHLASEVTTTARYNVCQDSWTDMAPLPEARGDVNAALLQGNIYVVGGSGQYDPEYATAYKNTTYAYSLSANSWTTVTNYPEKRAGIALAIADDKLYAFGGYDQMTASSAVYQYTPSANSWISRTTIPDGPRYLAAATTLNGKIYLAGGWPGLNRLDIYNPQTDSWSTGAPMLAGRHSFSLVTGSDGALYAIGGGTQKSPLSLVERYDPTADRWTPFTSLNEIDRLGTQAAFSEGQIFTFGGNGYLITPANESLTLNDSFCLSRLSVAPALAYAGELVTYTFEVHSGMTALTNATISTYIPTTATLVDFGPATITPAPTYVTETRSIEWHGELPAGEQPVTFTAILRLDTAPLSQAESLYLNPTFDSGNGMSLRFPIPVRKLPTDNNLAPSPLTVNRTTAHSGDLLTYTLQLKPIFSRQEAVTLSNLIPTHTHYVPGSLSYTTGSGSYDASAKTLFWNGATPVEITNTRSSYQYADFPFTRGNRELAPYADGKWLELDQPVTVKYYWDSFHGPIDLGFEFPLPGGASYHQVYLDSHGRLRFNTTNTYDMDLWAGCPQEYNAITPLGGSRNVVGTTRYQRYPDFFVVEFEQIKDWYDNNNYFSVQVQLYADGTVRFHYRNVHGTPTGAIQISGAGGPAAVFDCAAPVKSGQSVLFVPGNTRFYMPATLNYKVTIDENLGKNTHITNTVVFTDGNTRIYRRSAHVLVHHLDFNNSTFTPNYNYIHFNTTQTYTLVLHNQGTYTAANLTLTLPLNPVLTNTVPPACNIGNCSTASGTITWTGNIPENQMLTLTFGVASQAAAYGYPIYTHTATLRDPDGEIGQFTSPFRLYPPRYTTYLPLILRQAP